VTIETISGLAVHLRACFGTTVEFPEPALKLGLATRSGDSVRQFKHLHQMCAGHVDNFVQGNGVKLLSLLDGFLSIVQTENV
jgi:hypothetical protein